MTCRQTAPQQWLIIDRCPSGSLWAALRELRRGAGVIVLMPLGATDCRRLRHLARLRGLTVASEGAGAIGRVHNARELQKALLRRIPFILLSPIHRTRSHPDWQPLPRMRAAALARLAKRNLIALGGMNAQRYARIAPLGFIGWAGISAFRI